MPRLLFAALAAAMAATFVAAPVYAQARKPTAKEIAAVRACAEKYRDDVSEGERQCLFKIADPCTHTQEGQSTAGSVDCYRLEQAIWDQMLNDNFAKLRDDLDAEQKTKLRDMQRAWITYRDTTCEFYYHKIQGTMSGPMTAACMLRETGRRALLLDFFGRL
jgi:uncharacterized protein YecT (DUF1311 family)